jgi:hypothetical protein
VPKNISGLKRGGSPGRPKGVPNKATRQMKEWATELFESPEWRASAAQRIIDGKAPHLEAHCLQVLMPKTDKTDHTSNGKTLATLLVGEVS